MHSSRWRLFLLLFFVPLLAMGVSGSALAQEVGSELFDVLPYRHIGPQGNRISAVVGVPGDPNVCYAGAASGGVWKSVDGGIHWEPIFDDQPSQSIGSIAIAPSDPNVLWVGTGETFIRSNVSLGDGIYKSTDGGESWTQMDNGVREESGITFRGFTVDPRDSDTVYAAAEISSWQWAGEERIGREFDLTRGVVYKTTNGGRSCPSGSGSLWRRGTGTTMASC